MKEIRTIEEMDQSAFEDFMLLLLAEEESGNHFIETEKVADFPVFVAKSKRLESQTDDPNWSTVTTYYYFLDEEIAAKISCRWEIEKGNLLRTGGHIGYVTSPKFRRQGIMTELLDFAFERYCEKGVRSILITANRLNTPSRKVIEKAGGRLEDIIRLEDDFPNSHMAGQEVVRYWINL